MFVVAFLTVILAYATFFMITRTFRLEAKEVSNIRVDGPATVHIGDDTYENASLSDISFDPLPAGTHISYTVKMPDVQLSRPMFTLYIAHSKARVYIDGKLIYSYGEYKKNMFGYGHVSFPIDADYAGRELKVEYDVMEYKEVSSLEPPTITENAAYYYHNRACNLRHQYFIDFTLIMLGLAIAAVSLIMMFRDTEMIRLVFLATAIFGMGIWVLCNYDLINIFTDNLALKGYLEYLSFYIAPFFFTLYFADDYFHREKTFRRYIYLAILTAQGIFSIDCIVLHFAGIRHLPKSLPVSHVLLVTSLAYILYMSIRALIKKQHAHIPFVIGFFLLVVFCMRDMVYFVLFYYIGHNHGERYESRMLSGIFMFAISMFLDFFTVQSRRKKAEARNEVLGKMAYTDTMTGLYNRRKADEEFTVLNENGLPFGMIGFDLNDLKKTNDNYGHENGDKLLTDFSKLISDTFSKEFIACRMGGDEFLVIIPDITSVDESELMNDLQDRCNELNKTRKPLPLSYAHGYCSSTDPEVIDAVRQNNSDIATEVYKCSDKRMYECKLRMKGH